MFLVWTLTKGPPCRNNISGVQELLNAFLKTALHTKTIFQTDKSGDQPAVVHGAGRGSFQTAKDALAQDLARIVKTKDASTVYSVHVADINGLSQLENYILAHEIADFLGETDRCPFPHCSRVTNYNIQTLSRYPTASRLRH